MSTQHELSTNVAIHYALIALGEPRREAILEALSFTPRNPRAWNTLVSPLTSMFLHADAEHLWWNMIFLWVFGLVLERHIGSRRFAHLYILTGVIAGVVLALRFRLQARATEDMYTEKALAAIEAVDRAL